MSDSSSGSKLPAGVEAAWGLRERPARGPKPALSLDRILTAAVALADREGLAAVSMSKVASEVAVTAMALYRYVGNKDELLALMVDFALGAPPPPVEGESWRAGLEAWARAENGAYRAHPWALRIPIGGLPMLPNQVGWMERGLRSLAGTGLTEQAKLSIILMISNSVRGYASMETDLEAAFAKVGGSPDQVMAGFASTLGRLAGRGRFPALDAAVASGALDAADPPGKELEFGLSRLLDGVDALIKKTLSAP